MNWFTRDKLAGEVATLEKRKQQIALRRHRDRLQGDVAELEEQELYRSGDTATRSRIDARRNARATNHRSRFDSQRREVTASMGRRVGEEGLQLLAAMYGDTTKPETIRGRIAESVLEGFGSMPVDYGFLTGLFSNLYTLMATLKDPWPYKPTILRFLQQLDFARWGCRVLYEECPTAKGLVKGKTNFVIRRGLKCKVVRKDKGNEESEAQKTAQKFVDQFREENDFNLKEQERYKRRMIDGEAFLWVTDPHPDTATAENKSPSCEVAFIEPDFIRPSNKGTQGNEDPRVGGGPGGEDWSFGILTANHRYYRPIKYNVVWNTNEEDQLPAADVIHSAERERSNIKRCLPPLLSAADDIIRLTILRGALAESAKFRAAIGGVIKYEEASGEAIENGDDIYRNALSGGGGYSDEESYEPHEWRGKAAAHIVELAPGRDWVQGPIAPEGAGIEIVYNWHIQAVAQQFACPEWMVKGASSGASFADSLTAESPSVVEFETEQGIECGYTKRAVKRELAYRVRKGELPANFFDDFDVIVESDSVITRDSKSETETAVMQVTNQFCSLSTARANLGFDSQKEEKLIEGEKKLGLGPVWGAAPLPEDTEGSELKGGADKGGPSTTDGKRQELEGSKKEE